MIKIDSFRLKYLAASIDYTGGMDNQAFFDAVFEILAHKPKLSKPKPNKVRTVTVYKPRDGPLEMPEVLQAIIQEFARPVTRGDWRTAKEDESLAIRQLHYHKHHEAVDFLGGFEFWDILLSQSFYELLRFYPASGNTLQLRHHWG